MKDICLAAVAMVLCLCACWGDRAQSGRQAPITEEMALKGVSNYCHSEYDWSMAKENPSMMTLETGEPTDSAFHVVFRSYTGSFVHFYVHKASGITKMVEEVPALGIREDAGEINLFDHLEP